MIEENTWLPHISLNQWRYYQKWINKTSFFATRLLEKLAKSRCLASKILPKYFGIHAQPSIFKSKFPKQVCLFTKRTTLNKFGAVFGNDNFIPKQVLHQKLWDPWILEYGNLCLQRCPYLHSGFTASAKLVPIGTSSINTWYGIYIVLDIFPSPGTTYASTVLNIMSHPSERAYPRALQGRSGLYPEISSRLPHIL